MTKDILNLADFIKCPPSFTITIHVKSNIN
ncbi:hypothetical protein NC653_024957 [Populus alba x Populus x berolinensis]|uniref:Uncharacterized protein n=1 Tax=Populus alba x Populus x berolinensis TaxID=444605 RepID=A0AAD6Q9C4_9ROSI|nr:hypothetical protein NC653_024957 [Populus alba x Populus x berolinensis]